MTFQAQRSISIVNHDAMMNDSLFRKMHFVRKDKLSAMVETVNAIVQERVDFEAMQTRIVDGVYTVAQHGDIKVIEQYRDNVNFARLACALQLNVREYLHPASLDGGKSSEQTSNMKAYKKGYEIADAIFSGVSSLERVVRVNTVCAYLATVQGCEVLTREQSESFLNSRVLNTVDQASEDIWSAIDQYRAKQMSGGDKTQTSQMVRTLVAFKSAKDVRNGRNKDTAFNPDGLVLSALMRRFGILTDTVKQATEEQPQE